MHTNTLKLAAATTLVTMLVKEKIENHKLEKQLTEQAAMTLIVCDIATRLDKQVDYLQTILDEHQVPCTEFDKIVLNQLT